MTFLFSRGTITKQLLDNMWINAYDQYVKGKFGLLVILLLIVGAIVAAVVVQRSTTYQQHASQFSNINSAAEIGATNNPDGTMGPTTWQGNFSNTLPALYLGTLNFTVTDPPQDRMPAERIPTVTTSVSPTVSQDRGNRPSITPGAQQGATSVTPGQGEQNAYSGGPQAVTSLVVSIAKVEVHLARLGIPGEKNENQVTGKPSGTPAPQNNNQEVNKWETLNIGGVQTVDLVQLGKTHSLQSLGLTKLANGFYTEVRLYIKLATAVLADGTKVNLVMPGRANIVRVVEPFTIDSTKTTTLTMEFDAQNSVIKAGSQYLLNPVVAHMLEENQQ